MDSIVAILQLLSNVTTNPTWGVSSSVLELECAHLPYGFLPFNWFDVFIMSKVDSNHWLIDMG